MSARWFPIDANTRRALTDSLAYDGARITITDQLRPAVWSKIKTVLEKAGAVYVIGSSAFDFQPDQDAQTIVSAALTAGRVMGAPNAEGFVPTPSEVAADLVYVHAELSPQHGRRLRVLEPSAGAGRFVAAIRAHLGTQWCDITAVEPDARRAAQIPTDDATTVHVETFEAFAERALAAGDRFDAVVMNPPFAVPGSAALWADHLMTAWQLLAPGGRLVAIVPASVLHDGRTGRVRDAADLMHRHGGGELLDMDTFAESGIKVATAVVWLDRPYDRTAEPLPVSRPYVTRGAAEAMPVQIVRDGWRGTDRTLRHQGDCVSCSRPTWAFDDGDNDPRGVLGDATCHSLDPEEYGEPAGPAVGMCADCANDGDAFRRGMDAARRIWADAATPPKVAAIAVEPSTEGQFCQLDLFGALAA